MADKVPWIESPAGRRHLKRIRKLSILARKAGKKSPRSKGQNERNPRTPKKAARKAKGSPDEQAFQEIFFAGYYVGQAHSWADSRGFSRAGFTLGVFRALQRATGG